VANFAENGADALQHHVEGVLLLLEQAGAIVQRYGGVETLVAAERFDLVAIMQFPREESMNQFLESGAYAAMEAYREKRFAS
jgi:uncharacterized protein (DUF1330 family)